MNRIFCQASTFAVATVLSFVWFSCEAPVAEKSFSESNEPPCKCPEPGVQPLAEGSYQFVKDSYAGMTADYPGMKATLTREQIILETEITGPDDKKVKLVAEYRIKELSTDK
jgi:hypothetical protein